MSVNSTAIGWSTGRASLPSRDIYVEDYLKPLRDEAGELTGYVGCMVDISDEHRSAQQSDALARKVEELTLPKRSLRAPPALGAG